MTILFAKLDMPHDSTSVNYGQQFTLTCPTRISEATFEAFNNTWRAYIRDGLTHNEDVLEVRRPDQMEEVS